MVHTCRLSAPVLSGVGAEPVCHGEPLTGAIAGEFESHRLRLFGPAYRMPGSADEGEDTVQDAYLRFSGA